MTSCEDVIDEPVSECAQDNDGILEVNGVALNIFRALITIREGSIGDVYYFQVYGNHNDCIDMQGMTISIEIPTDSNFDGTYNVPGDLKVLEFVNSTEGTLPTYDNFDSGTLVVNKLNEREYEAEMTGILLTGEFVEVYFKTEF